MDNIQTNILIIGGPNVGKTHFGGQLYCRLDSRQFTYKISSNNRPEDLSIFQEVLEKLYNGTSAGHTQTSAHKSLKLFIEDPKSNIVSLTFPDYGGEQIRDILATRRVDQIWKKSIDDSNSWVLFVRLDEILAIEDIINKGIPSADEISKRNEKTPPVKLSDSAQFIELLQILLYIKGVNKRKRESLQHLKLTVVLSCWDLLNIAEGIPPIALLKERLPLFYSFLNNVWGIKYFKVLGLSSTEKTLTNSPDEAFIDNTPIKYGYFIDKEGNKELDLTKTLGIFIGDE